MNGTATRLTAVRVAQGALAVLALLAALSWNEQAPDLHTAGRETLALSFEAPVLSSAGPWRAGDRFTERDAGVRLDLAPIWTVTARNSVTGLASDGDAWRAESRITKVGGDGRPWWTRVEPIPVATTGPVVQVDLDAAAVVERAKALDEASEVQGRLDIHLVFQHSGSVDVRGAYQPTTRVATISIVPSETDAVAVAVQGDSAEWSVAAERGPPVAAASAALLALALEPVARRFAARAPPWSRVRGVRVLEADGVRVPPDAPRCTLQDAMGAARDTGSVLLVDRARGVAVVEGAVRLVAPLDGAGRLPVVPRPRAPVRPPRDRPARVPAIPDALRPVARAPEEPPVALEMLGAVEALLPRADDAEPDVTFEFVRPPPGKPPRRAPP